MNAKEVNDKLITFWDSHFSGVAPMKIDLVQTKVEDNLDKHLKWLGDNATRVLDIGTGMGIPLISAKIFGTKMKYGLGIDTSVNGITFANETCKLSNIEGVEFKVGDNQLLKTIQDNSFDGIICSNTLDVIPSKTAEDIIKNIKRILVPGGHILLKFNFFLTKDLITRLKMEEIDKDSFTMNGVLRGVNHTNEEWISYFDGFKTILIDEYERVPGNPKDRIIILEKNK